MATGGGNVLGLPTGRKAAPLRPSAAGPVRTMNGGRWITAGARGPPRKPTKPPPPPMPPRAKVASGTNSAAPASVRAARPANFRNIAVSGVERRAAALDLGLETDRKRVPPVCRLNRRTDFQGKLTQSLEPDLTSCRLNNAGGRWGRGLM